MPLQTLQNGMPGGVFRDVLNSNFSYLDSQVLDQDVVDINDFILGGASTSEEQTAELGRLQAAVYAARDQGKALFISRNVKIAKVNGTVEVPVSVSIYGNGGKVVSSVDAPLFRYSEATSVLNADGVSVHVGGFYFDCQYSSSPADSACAVTFVGEQAGEAGRLDYVKVRDIVARGVVAAVVVDKAPRSTPFGLEGNFNWHTFENITVFDGDWTPNTPSTPGRPSKHAVLFKRGSGTGGTFSGIKGQIGRNGGAWLKFEGTDCVVGDILVSNCHLASANQSLDIAALEVGANTKYRTNIMVENTQCDANLQRVFRLSDTGSVDYQNIHFDGLIGGLCALGINKPINTQNVEDKDQGVWRGGKQPSAVLATGLQTLNLFTVELDPFSSVIVDMAVTGVVSGVAPVVYDTLIGIRSDGTTVLTPSQDVRISSPGGAIAVVVGIAGLVATVSITYTPTSPGSSVGANWKVRGNRFIGKKL